MIHLRIGQLLQMSKKCVAKLGCKAYRCLRRKILRCDGAHQADDSKQDHHQTHPSHIAPVAVLDAYVHDHLHHKRHKQFKGSLQHLEQRRQHRLLFVILQKYEQFFHFFLRSTNIYRKSWILLSSNPLIST